jgi:hypothetical protein
VLAGPRRRWTGAILDVGRVAWIVGEHSFRGFAKSGQPERGYRAGCTMPLAGVAGGGLEFRIVADRFLHHMVRYLVGTMVDAARGRRPATDVALLLDETTDWTGWRRARPAPAGGSVPGPRLLSYAGGRLNPEGPENEDLP